MWNLAKHVDCTTAEFEEFDVKPTIYSYNELRTATRDFHMDMKLGEGAYGAVYKVGLLHMHIVFIVKKIVFKKCNFIAFKVWFLVIIWFSMFDYAGCVVKWECCGCETALCKDNSGYRRVFERSCPYYWDEAPKPRELERVLPSWTPKVIGLRVGRQLWYWESSIGRWVVIFFLSNNISEFETW